MPPPLSVAKQSVHVPVCLFHGRKDLEFFLHSIEADFPETIQQALPFPSCQWLGSFFCHRALYPLLCPSPWNFFLTVLPTSVSLFLGLSRSLPKTHPILPCPLPLSVFQKWPLLTQLPVTCSDITRRGEARTWGGNLILSVCLNKAVITSTKLHPRLAFHILYPLKLLWAPFLFAFKCLWRLSIFPPAAHGLYKGPG